MAVDVAGGTASAGLVVNDNPTANQVNGYNATGASGAVTDRGIATAPTGIAGSAIQLLISNGTGGALNGLTISYDIRRYQIGADAAGRSPPHGIPEGSDELPGYWLFYSLDNGANFHRCRFVDSGWSGPSSQPIVPNTVGITSIANASFSLSGAWNAGSNLVLRWIDDNAIDPSPDEIIGIDNVQLGVPEPSSLVLSAVAFSRVAVSFAGDPGALAKDIAKFGCIAKCTIRSLRFYLSAISAALGPVAYALDGGLLQMIPRNGWRAFEVISVGNNPAGDGFNYAMPGTFDGLAPGSRTPSTLRVPVNHETSDASVSEVNLNLANFKTAISNMIAGGTTGRRQLRQFRPTGLRPLEQRRRRGVGPTLPTPQPPPSSASVPASPTTPTPLAPAAASSTTSTSPARRAATNRLFALDLANRDFYRLSGVSGSAPGGIGGMPFDSWENAALLDTGETNHVALLLSPDGGTQRMQLYIGEKGKGTTGAASADFLARNGLAYGSYYYLNDTLPASGTSLDGMIDATPAGALTSTKLEDVDTSPSDPTQVVLGDEDSGVFTFDFNLDFSGGSFNAAGSSFSITKILNHNNDIDGAVGDADNVDWTDATVLNGVSYPSGLIFVNEDSGTANGETWMSRPDGSGLTLIADNVGISTATESSGILDISRLVGYSPGSVLLTANQGSIASLTVLINPNATQVPEPTSMALSGVSLCSDAAPSRRHSSCIAASGETDLRQGCLALKPCEASIWARPCRSP